MQQMERCCLCNIICDYHPTVPFIPLSQNRHKSNYLHWRPIRSVDKQMDYRKLRNSIGFLSFFQHQFYFRTFYLTLSPRVRERKFTVRKLRPRLRCQTIASLSRPCVQNLVCLDVSRPCNIERTTPPRASIFGLDILASFRDLNWVSLLQVLTR